MKVLIAGIPDLTKNYENALQRLCVPFDTSLCPDNLDGYDRLLLPGGGDISPAWFGQSVQGSENIDPETDRAQFILLDAFVRAGKPVLGICKGMQIINVYFGGDIIQNLATAPAHKYIGHDQVHRVYSRPGSVLWQLYGPSCLVNSAHHQGCGRTGRGLLVTEVSPDGVIEALEHTEKPILGVQWHPERMGFLPRHPEIPDGDDLIRFCLTR